MELMFKFGMWKASIKSEGMVSVTLTLLRFNSLGWSVTHTIF